MEANPLVPNVSPKADAAPATIRDMMREAAEAISATHETIRTSHNEAGSAQQDILQKLESIAERWEQGLRTELTQVRQAAQLLQREVLTSRQQTKELLQHIEGDRQRIALLEMQLAETNKALSEHADALGPGCPASSTIFRPPSAVPCGSDPQQSETHPPGGGHRAGAGYGARLGTARPVRRRHST